MQPDDEDDPFLTLTSDDGRVVDGEEGYEFGWIPGEYDNPEGTTIEIDVAIQPIQDPDYNYWWPYIITYQSRYNTRIMAQSSYGPSTKYLHPLQVARTIERDILPTLD